MTRLKIAELTSAVGALVLGVGLVRCSLSGLPRLPAPLCSPERSLTPFGMWDKHRLEGQAHAPSEPWVTVL